MSLELAIQQNTAAINELVALLKSGIVPAAPAAIDEPDAPAETPKAEVKKTRAKKETAPAGEPADGAEAPAPQEATAPASSDKAPPSYTETAKWVVEVGNKKGRDAAVAILAKYGARKLGEVKASSYADVIAACQAVL